MTDNTVKPDKLLLFNKQKETMETLLKCGAITKKQFDYSLSCLKNKMNIPNENTK